MFYSMRNRLNRSWFQFHCRRILTTPPLVPIKSRLKILSLVSHRDVLMYLLAIKSFYFYVGHGQIIVINDGTLTKDDVKLLVNHLSDPEIVEIHQIDNQTCPKRICWERLLYIADYASDNYTVQLDSDTLTIGHIPEVLQAIEQETCFTLGTGMGRSITPMNQTCEQMKNYNNSHVQVAAESSFERLTNYQQLKYVRGCAGFAGFARKSVLRTQVEEFSREMENILGKKWHEWGSDQVTSNFIVANTPRSLVLPHPKYNNFSPDIMDEQSSFLHFIGSYRFQKGVYIQKAKSIMNTLQSAVR